MIYLDWDNTDHSHSMDLPCDWSILCHVTR